MINLIKNSNLNVGILQYDFDVYKKIAETFNEPQKSEIITDINSYKTPSIFNNKLINVIETNRLLTGYVIYEFKSNNNDSYVSVEKLFVFDEYKNKGIEEILLESLIYVSSEVGTRNVVAKVNESEINLYKEVGFYESGIESNLKIMRVNVTSCVNARRLIDKFRRLPSDYIDYKSIKILKKIAETKVSNIYLTDDGRILKMFVSNSFIDIKEKEEKLNYIKKINVDEILKPKNLVYYDGIFVGYIMDYLPDGKNLWDVKENYSFESKIDKIKELEKVIKNLHANNIYLCYLDLNNIFYDKNGNLKIIDCDSFSITNKGFDSNIPLKYKDPNEILVNEKSDLYAFAVVCLELLTNIRIPNDTKFEDVEKVYLKNKSKLPTSFKEYFERIFKGNERCYLSDSYEKYIDEIYNTVDTEEMKSGKISVVILSIMMVLIAIIGYFVFRIIR